MVMFIASWSERDRLDGIAGGSTVALPWEQARDALAETLLRNLDRWTAPETRAGYQEALQRLETAGQPVAGWHAILRDHILTITEESRLEGLSRS